MSATGVADGRRFFGDHGERILRIYDTGDMFVLDAWDNDGRVNFVMDSNEAQVLLNYLKQRLEGHKEAS